MNVDTIEKVEEIVAQGESSRVEFKETTGQLDKAMETLCAFLNAKGGVVLFGVNNKGKIIGQEVTDKTKRDIAEAIHRFEPLATITTSYIDISCDKQVIAVCAENQFYMRPFSYRGKPYQRFETTTFVMFQDAYQQLLMQRGGFYVWDSMINPFLKISDLDPNFITGAVRGGVRSGRLPESTLSEDIPTILKKFNLLNDGKLNNAAGVLFGQDLYYYPQSLLRMARFKGTNKEEFRDNQRATGNIYQLLDAAMAFFFKHLSLSGKIEGLYRTEELTIPYRALRECCINALCHRVYHRPGSSVGIAIYDDRIEVENSGTFPPNMTMERLLSEHNSEPPNAIIADVLYKSGILENWGRGIELMISECRRVGVPDPELRTNDFAVWVVFRYKDETKSDDPTVVPSCPQSVPSLSPVCPQLTSSNESYAKGVLAALSVDTLSISSLMVKVGMKNKNRFRQRVLSPLIEAGLIELTIKDKPNSSKQAYRLTEKGHAFLAQGE